MACAQGAKLILMSFLTDLNDAHARNDRQAKFGGAILDASLITGDHQNKPLKKLICKQRRQASQMNGHR
jgi:hypothetical protein